MKNPIWSSKATIKMKALALSFKKQMNMEQMLT